MHRNPEIDWSTVWIMADSWNWVEQMPLILGKVCQLNNPVLCFCFWFFFFNKPYRKIHRKFLNGLCSGSHFFSIFPQMAHRYRSFFSVKCSGEFLYTTLFLLSMTNFYRYYFSYKYNFPCLLIWATFKF